jgi:hypothetical protein
MRHKIHLEHMLSLFMRIDINFGRSSRWSEANGEIGRKTSPLTPTGFYRGERENGYT